MYSDAVRRKCSGKSVPQLRLLDRQISHLVPCKILCTYTAPRRNRSGRLAPSNRRPPATATSLVTNIPGRRLLARKSMILPTLSWWKGSLVIKNASGRSLIMAVKALSNSSEQRTGSSELRTGTGSTLSQRLYQQQRPDLLADTRGQRRNQATSHRRLSGEIAVERSRVRR